MRSTQFLDLFDIKKESRRVGVRLGSELGLGSGLLLTRLSQSLYQLVRPYPLVCKFDFDTKEGSGHQEHAIDC